MTKLMPFRDFVEINPKVELKRGLEYPFVEMAIVAPSRRYIRTDEKRVYSGGGSKFSPRDILFARITPCLENGKIGQFIDENNRNGFGSTEFFIFRAKPGISDPAFVFYFVSTETIRKPAEKSMSGASGRQRADLSSIQDIMVDVYPLPTQRKIAAILSAYDDLIENNTRRIKILEEMAQAIYCEWFVHFRFPGHEGVRMVESEMGMIPEGWVVRKLGNIATEIRRSVDPNNLDPNTPYVGLEHIPRKSIALADWGLAKEVQSTKHQFFTKEILFGKIRPYFHKVVIAPIDGVCSSDAIVIQPLKPDFFAIVLFCVFSEDFVNHATQTSQGTKMPRANWNVLVNYSVVIPPKPLLEEFNRIVFDIVDIIIIKIFQNTNLRRTRDLLLPKLISGELDVSELDIKIPEAMT